jgi:hypothetical protein
MHLVKVATQHDVDAHVLDVLEDSLRSRQRRRTSPGATADEVVMDHEDSDTAR